MKRRFNVILAIGASLLIILATFQIADLFSGKESNIQNPADVLVLVNKEHYLSKDYVPTDLRVARVDFVKDIAQEEMQMRQEAASALEELFKRASAAGLHLYGESGYRSFASQKRNYDWISSTNGSDYASYYVALPGKSEHQTGLAMDITNLNYVDDENDKNLFKTKEGIWLAENAHRFGFILRYPQDKIEITRYNFEPWHFRYVGQQAATDIFQKRVTLEEYLGKAVQPPADRAKPISEWPASGMCANPYEGLIATVAIDQDVPVSNPRCQLLRPNQKLRVVNHTSELQHVGLGRFQADIKPGGEYTFDMPLGEYLEPGVYLLTGANGFSPELWLNLFW